MSIHNRDLHDFVFNDPPPDDDRLAALRHEVVDAFDYRRKKNVVAVTFWVLVCIGFIFVGAWGLATANDTKSMLLSLFLMMIGLESSVLIKLWFWVVDSRDVMAREIKHVQLQLTMLAASHPEQTIRGSGEEGESPC